MTADWDSTQYLRFEEERTWPCRDLVARLELEDPATIVDLGCGPGTSTETLALRYPKARIRGLDSSPDMIAAARGRYPHLDWMIADIAAWAAHDEDEVSLLFSNAALQWVPDHRALLPCLLRRTEEGGALAVQMPANAESPPQQAMRDLAASHVWRPHFPAEAIATWKSNDAQFYYDVLAPHASRIVLWYTDYIHVLGDVSDIGEWYRGTGLRPYLNNLASKELQTRFVQDFVKLISPSFPERTDGRILFPFRRIFIIAYKE